MRTILWRWLLVILWMGLIFLVSSSSNPYQVLPDDWTVRCAQIIHWEKPGRMICQNNTGGILSHLLEYAVLSFLFANALDYSMRTQTTKGLRTKPVGNISHLLAFIATVLFAFSDEVHQIVIPGRTFEIFDVSLDVIGAALGTLLSWFVKRRTSI